MDKQLYIGGEVYIIEKVDIDFLSFFELKGYVNDLGYQNPCQMWFRISGLGGIEGLEEIEKDQNVSNILQYNKGEDHIDIYFVEIIPLNAIAMSGPSHMENNKGEEVNNVQTNKGWGEVTNDHDSDFGDISYEPSGAISVEDIDGVSLSSEVESEGNENGLTKDSAQDAANDINEKDVSEFDEMGSDSDELHSLRGSDDDRPEYPDFNEKTGLGNPELCSGMKFSSVIVFRKALKEWAIRRGFDYDFINNNRQKVTVICKVKCGFRIHASKLRGFDTFQIKTFKPNHSCPRDNKNKLVGSSYIAEKYIEDLRDNPNYAVDALSNKIQRELGTEVSAAKCYRARNVAKKIFEGDVREQYRRLYDYAETIKKRNPGSMIKIKTELQFDEQHVENGQISRIPKDIVVFQYMYVRLTTQKQGYFSGLRPIIGLDGCFLKSPMGGQLLSAVARDGNENMFPLALGCVDIECKASWEWFLEMLFEDFGSPSDTKWVFMSDQQNGLVEAMNTLMPGVEHRFCVKHMYENMKLHFKGLEYKKLLWVAAKAGIIKLWEHHMEKLKQFDEGAWKWVMDHDPMTWARCNFSTHTKSDAVQNNMSESFNSCINKARDKPVLSMFEYVRKKMMKRNHVNYEGMKKYKGDICPAYQEKLEKLKLYARNCFCTTAGDLQYSVDCGDTTSVVDLKERSCSCRMWDISGVPCKHAIAAIYTNREKPEQYVHEYFFKSVYLRVYKHIMHPISSKEEWEKTELPDIHPWIVKKPAGRPKKKRTRRADKPRNPFKVTRAGGTVMCGNCKREGHNSRGCTASVTGETTWQRRIRKEKNKLLGNVGQSSPPKRSGRPRNIAIAQPPQLASQPSATLNVEQPSLSKRRGRPRRVPNNSFSQPPPTSRPIILSEASSSQPNTS